MVQPLNERLIQPDHLDLSPPEIEIMRVFISNKSMTSALMLITCLFVTQNAFAIKKCKDEDGNWHYGDHAEDKCTTTKVTTLTERGFIAETLEAPKTEEEKQAEAEKLRKEQEELARLQKRQEERDRILSIYETEQDIDRQRDNQIESIDSNIKVHEAYLKQMDGKIKRLETKVAAAGAGKTKDNLEKELIRSKGRVVEFSKELEGLKVQRTKTAEKFAEEKRLYRELTSSQ